MDNTNVNLLINVNHPFWLELKVYQKRWLQFRNSLGFLRKKSYNDFLNQLDLIVEEHNNNMKKLYAIDKDTFKEIYKINSKFLDDQIKREENPSRNRDFSPRKIRSILELYRPKFENVLAEVVVNHYGTDFEDLIGDNVLQKCLLFDYFFVNPNEKVKEQMKKKEYYAKVIGVFICAKSETVRTSISKINNGHYDHSDISDRSIEILENNGITFYHT